MQPTLDDYRAVAPAGTVDFLRRLSERVRGRRLLNALQGGGDRLPEGLFEEYRLFTRTHAAAVDATADMVVTHDALPAGLVETRPQEGAWVWRCHLDVSRP